LKRLLHAVPVALGVSLISFTLINILPGSTAASILGLGASPSAIAALDLKLGLNKPFFDRYFTWLGHLLTGHLGTSLDSGQSITSILALRMPVTVELVIMAFLLSLIFTIPTALLASYRPRGIVDRASALTSMVGLTMPPFVLGLILILVFSLHLHLLPATGYVPLSQSIPENLRYMLLPAITLGFGIFCAYTRVLRADLVDQMRAEDYVMVARGKGLSRRQVLIHHVLRNALFPLITLIGINAGTILGGSVLVEQIFALPGMGTLILNSILTKDVTVVPVVLVFAAVTVVVANLLTDVTYVLLDPRVRYGNSDN
jgi:peptide/nickel transport system permease protein